MKFRYALSLAILLTCIGRLSAQSLPNTLLWRISGKDGHHTSYLYGTMHLTDARIFHLGDSLYAAIHHSDGLAIELDPNTLFSLAVEEFQEQITRDQRKVRELLSDEEYKTYGPLLEKKLKKPIGSITTEDILHEKNKWVGESYRTGKMSTFLDLYLYETARREKKWTGGVEDIGDQRGLVSEIVDKSDINEIIAEDHSPVVRQGLDRMIDIYLRQDLTALDSFMGDSASKDRIIIQRNKKMAYRMDSLSGVRSMVFAVGAAHLPGSQGLIHLLRERGFRVDPVFSSQKIKPVDYTLQEPPPYWDTVTDDNGFFRIAMPGKPGEVEFYQVVKMKIYFDFFRSTAYICMAIPSAYTAQKSDSIMNKLAERMFSQKSKKEYVNVDLGGVSGRMYTSREDDRYQKGFVGIRSGIFYMAFASAGKETDKNKESINKFLSSFKSLDRAVTNGDSIKMLTHLEPDMGYSIQTPTEAKLNNNTTTAIGRSRLYICADPNEGTYYFFGANSVAPGHFIINDSTYFKNLKTTVAAKFRNMDFDTSWIANDQLITEFGGRMKDADLTMKVRYIVRGNRWYVVIAMYPLSGPTPKVTRFFSSFSLVDYPNTDWTQYSSEDSVFRTTLPAPIHKVPRTGEDKTTDNEYLSYDSSRAESLEVVAYHLNAYYWNNSDSGFWADRVAAHVGKSDSLVYKKAVRNGEANGWEWVMVSRGSHNYQRQRMLRNGDEMYTLTSAGPYKQVCSITEDRFFEDFRFSAAPRATTYLDSKARRLIDDLFATDSARRAGALAFFGQAAFGKKDLPLLHKALLRVSPMDSANKQNPRVNNTIARKIRSFKDSSSFQFALENYHTVSDSNSYIKDNLLTVMAEFTDDAHFAKMAGLLASHPPAAPLSWQFVNQLQNNLALTAHIFPDLLPLFKDSTVRPSLGFITLRLLDSGLLTTTQLLPFRQEILGYGNVRVHKLLTDPTDWARYDQQLIAVCGRFNDAQSNELLRQYSSVNDISIKFIALKALLYNKQTPDPATIRSLAADRDYRPEVYRLLKKAGHSDLFPLAYRTQQAFGECLVKDYAENEDDDDDFKITFLSARIASTAGGRKQFLFYKFENGDKAWLACAGPYALDPAEFDAPDARAIIDFDTPIQPGTINSQKDSLLQRFNR